MSTVATIDPEIKRIIENEEKRQREQLVMIASENYTSAAVLEATGSVLTNKYAEGYPGRRYYAGCENVDISEQLAIDRAKELFGADPCWVAGEHGGSLRTRSTWRPDHGHVARPRRAFNTRLAG